MDKSMVKGFVVGGVAMVVVGAGAVTGYQKLTQPKVAEVVAVKEVMQTVTTPREQCETVQVQHRAPVKDENRLLGTVGGAVIGGVLGNQIGGGSGKKVATVAGAAAGGYAGNQVQRSMQDKDVKTTTEQRCKTVQEKSQKLVGYDVDFRIGSQTGAVRTTFRPGATLPLKKDGQVDTTPPQAS
jgi:uncharacterized protein YcfJ